MITLEKLPPHLVLHLAMTFCKFKTLQEHGFSDEQNNAIQEYEFTYLDDEQLVTEMEIWTNSDRTEGYQTLKVSTEQGKELGQVFNDFTCKL